MFGECPREGFGKFKPDQVVTICDHLQFFLFGQAKYEIVRQSIPLALDGLIEDLVGTPYISVRSVSMIILCPCSVNSSVSMDLGDFMGPSFIIVTNWIPIAVNIVDFQNDPI